MKTVLALTILYILIFTTGTIAQQPSTAQLLAAGKCEPFDGQPISCVDIMVGEWSTIWTVPTYGVTQEYLNAQLFKVIAATNTTIVTALEFTNLMPYDCAIGYLRLICTNAFKPCTVPPPDAVGVPPAIPHPICREVCEETNVACAPFWEARNLSAIDCEATNNGVPVYPPSDFNPQLGFFTCMVAPVLNSTPSYECPEGTVLIGPDHVDPNSDLPCAVPCPDKLTLPVDGASNFYRQYVTISVLGWISFVCCNITIVTYLIFAPLRRYPQRIILYAAIGLWVLHLGQVGSSFFGAPDLLCDGQFQWQTATGSWCKFASFCLFWGSMFTAIIWTYLAFIIFWNVALLRVKDKRAQYGEYIILPLAIVYATIESLILLWYPTSEASGGYLSGFPFCGLGPGADRNLFWGILIAPVTFCLLLVVIFTLGAIIKIIITPTGDSVRKALGKRLPAQILLFVFVLSFMTVIVAVIAVQAYGQQYRPAIEQGVENWYACVYAGYIPYDECPTGPTYVSNSIWWYQQIMLGLIGFLFFITFVLLKAEVRNLWVGTFTNCARGEFALASTDIYATTRGVTGGSGKSSGSAH